MKVLFAGTPDFAVPPLRALAKDHEIVGVFTQPDRPSGRGKKMTSPPVKVVAQELNVPVYQPSTLKQQAQIDIIEQLQPDVMVVVAYGMLLPQAVLDLPPLGCINIHASLLPRWRGAAPIHRAIEAGDTQTGVAIMRMELGLDTGPVYQMLSTPITDTDTTAILHNRLAELGAVGICQTLTILASEPETIPTPQNDELACYAKKLQKHEAQIDWSLSAERTHCRIRAFNPFPVCQTMHNDMRIRIWQASVVSNSGRDNPAGTVIGIDQRGAIVQCGQGALRIEVLQRDGSKALDWPVFANGYQINVGDTLTQAG